MMRNGGLDIGEGRAFGERMMMRRWANGSIGPVRLRMGSARRARRGKVRCGAEGMCLYV